MKGPMDERMKGTMSERGRNIKHRSQNLSKKNAKIDQNGAKIDPTSTQKGPKTRPRETTNQSSVFKTILDPSGGRFPHFCVVVWEPFGGQNRCKIRKKTDAKNR